MLDSHKLPGQLQLINSYYTYAYPELRNNDPHTDLT
jgi:hypothetical protein